MKKKAALHNLGCKVNAYEVEAMQQLLEQARLLVEQERRLVAVENRQNELDLKVQRNSDTMDKVTAAYVAPISSGDNWQESANHTINALSSISVSTTRCSAGNSMRNWNVNPAAISNSV